MPDLLVTLVGGGPDTLTSAAVAAPFAVRARQRAAAHGRAPRLALVLDDPEGRGRRWAPAYLVAVAQAGAEVSTIALDRAHRLDADALAGLDGLVVAGGSTPAYHAGLMPVADALRGAVLDGGLPYLGFSAGAMIAARTAIVGGWRTGGVAVSPEDWSEGLDDVTAAPGLGLVPWAVDVHTAQAGLLGRAVAAVASGLVGEVAAVDEDTALVVSAAGAQVVGSGRCLRVTAAVGGERAAVVAPW